MKTTTTLLNARRLVRRGLVAAMLLLPGCAGGFTAFQRSLSTRHESCVNACELVLGQTSVGYDDGKGHCTCYSPASGWERGAGVSMARISLASHLTRVASIDPRSP